MSTVPDFQGEELIKSLKAEFSVSEFPSLRIENQNGAICVRMLGFWSGIAGKGKDGNWVVNEEVKLVARNYIVFKALESKLIGKDPSYRGAYLLVNSPKSRFVYETHDSASRDMERYGFLGRIGIEDSSEEVLVLDPIEKPPNFDALDAREIEHVFVPHKGIYCNRSRRWLCVSLLLTKARGFRREFFLLDTGSPKSVLIREIADELVKKKFASSGNPIIEIEGIEVELELQDFDGGDSRTRNINLLGTDFLNSVVLIDDFVSRNIMIVKRATPPREIV